MDELVWFYPRGHEAHSEVGHPEHPERIETIMKTLKGKGWWDCFPHLEPVDIPEEVLTGVHTTGYLDQLKRASQSGQSLDMDTYTTPASWDLALKAAGGAAAVAQAVWQRQARVGFALCRPPGHHATRNRGMGFCLLNNIAIAADTLIHNAGAERLAIVDLDLHHGNGTQDIFYSRGDVFYISTHQSPLYPGTGSLHETGSGEGTRANANLPLPPGSGDRAFQTAMDELILPLLGRFDPQMVLVSFGFDPHWRDPLGQLNLSAGKIGELMKNLVDWAQVNCEGRLAVFLEGGYDLQAAQATTLTVTAALLGEPWDDLLGPSPVPETLAWQSNLKAAKTIWEL